MNFFMSNVILLQSKHHTPDILLLSVTSMRTKLSIMNRQDTSPDRQDPHSCCKESNATQPVKKAKKSKETSIQEEEECLQASISL